MRYTKVELKSGVELSLSPCILSIPNAFLSRLEAANTGFLWGHAKEFQNFVGTRSYYQLKNVETNMRKQLKWFMKFMLLLQKVDSMSNDSYTPLAWAKEGTKVDWAVVVHYRIMLEMGEKDRRKEVNKSELCTFLRDLLDFEEVKAVSPLKSLRPRLSPTLGKRKEGKREVSQK